MSDRTVGILHPGAMGSQVGAALRVGKSRVLWCPEGRSQATRSRAEKAGLEGVDTVDSFLRRVEIVFSVCPPSAAVALAEQVAGAGYQGLYVDANAVAPATARKIGEVLTAAGIEFVDGGLIGPPPVRAGSTRLYLSGDRSSELTKLFAESPLEAITIEGGPGAASALKMAYAAWTKSSAAMLTAIRALAVHEGVEAPLLDEWNLSQSGIAARSEAGARMTAPKAWRFEGEMEEIAATFADAGLPEGFHQAAGEIYRRLAEFKDASPPPELAEVIRKVVDRKDRGEAS